MTIRHHCENGIATISIDRPDKLNALDGDHLSQLRTQLSFYDAQFDVRAMILTGSGERAFCVGADLTATRQEASFGESFSFDLDLSAERGIYIRLFDLSTLKLRKPLIAAVNGYCLGGGLELALQCDLIVASNTASFGLPEVVVSSLPGGGGVHNLLRAVPRAVAMHMLVTGDRIDATRAYQIGLVSELYEPQNLETAAQSLATKIANNGPVAVQLVKMLSDQSLGASSSQAMQLTELAWGLLRDTEDRKEGRAAFAVKRKPLYQGR